MVYISTLIGVSILIYLYQKIIRWKPLSLPFLNKQELFIYGHRGVPTQAPENTLLSFQKAIELNVHGIELDVQITKDKILVVHHDTHLERLTGIPTLISTLTYKKLLTIDARGGDFDSLEIQRIPKLEDVLEILPENTAINIEIKSQQLFNEKMEKPVVDLIIKFDLLNRAIVSSYNPLPLRKIKKLNSKIKTAQIWNEEMEFSYLCWVYVSRPDVFHGQIDQLNSKIISNLKKLRLKIYAFTVNSPEQLAKVKHLNLDGIFTDDPTLFT